MITDQVISDHLLITDHPPHSHVDHHNYKVQSAHVAQSAFTETAVAAVPGRGKGTNCAETDQIRDQIDHRPIRAKHRRNDESEHNLDNFGDAPAGGQVVRVEVHFAHCLFAEEEEVEQEGTVGNG